ncbi:hypothetical protein ACTVH1_16915 [Gluconobacter cerinus]
MPAEPENDTTQEFRAADVVETFIGSIEDRTLGGIDTFHQGSIIKEIVGQSEPVMTAACDAIWKRLNDSQSLKEADLKDSARKPGASQVSVSLIECPANELGRKPYRFFELRSEGEVYLVCMKLDVKEATPEQEMQALSKEDFLSSVLTSLKLTASSPDAEVTDTVSELILTRLGGRHSSETDIHDAIARVLLHPEGYSSKRIYTVSNAYSGRRWMPGNVNLYDAGETVLAAGEAVGQAVDALGLQEDIAPVVEKTHADVARHWLYAEPTLNGDIARMTTMALGRDGFLPGPATRALTDELDQGNLLGAVPKLCQNLEKLAAIFFRPGDTQGEVEFSGNDGRDIIRMKQGQEAEGVQAPLSAEVTTQNWKASFILTEERLYIDAGRAYSGVEPSLSVVIRRGEKPELEVGRVPRGTGTVRTVNGMKLSLDSLVCCAQEDFRRPEGPGQSHP